MDKYWIVLNSWPIVSFIYHHLAFSNVIFFSSFQLCDSIIRFNSIRYRWAILNLLKKMGRKIILIVLGLGETIDPGGPKAIMLFAGRDASEEFNMIHDKKVVAKYAAKTILGTLKA